MNNKDLFNAINDIDEKFITDAGKYLKNDFGGFRGEEPIEVRPAETTFSPMRWIAPIAAAIVLFVGIGVALRAGIITINIQPLHEGGNIAAANSEEADAQGTNYAPAASVGSDTVENQGVLDSNPVTMPSAEKSKLSGDLPFTLYGPDMVQIKYEDVSKISTTENATLQDLSGSNWSMINCDFAYISEPIGANYNSIEIPGMFTDEVHFAYNASFRRIYNGEKFGNLTVSYARSSFRKKLTDGMSEKEMLENNIPMTMLFYDSVVSFDGEITAEGFIIRDEDGKHRFIMSVGERQIPGMNYTAKTDNGTFGADLAYESINSYQYMGELPAIEIDIDDAWGIYNYYPDRDWQRVLITLSNIEIFWCNAYDKNYYHVYADAEKVIPCDWYNVSDTDTEFDRIRDELSDFIDSVSSIEELNEMGDMIREKFDVNYEYFRVYYGVAAEDGDKQVEVLENGRLEPGMVVYMYNKEGEVVGVFTYQKT